MMYIYNRKHREKYVYTPTFLNIYTRVHVYTYTSLRDILPRQLVIAPKTLPPISDMMYARKIITSLITPWDLRELRPRELSSVSEGWKNYSLFLHENTAIFVRAQIAD